MSYSFKYLDGYICQACPESIFNTKKYVARQHSNEITDKLGEIVEVFEHNNCRRRWWEEKAE